MVVLCTPSVFFFSILDGITRPLFSIDYIMGTRWQGCMGNSVGCMEINEEDKSQTKPHEEPTDINTSKTDICMIKETCDMTTTKISSWEDE